MYPEAGPPHNITEEKHLTTSKKEGCHEIAASEQKGTLRKTDIKKN